jgi:hypothetical protein
MVLSYAAEQPLVAPAQRAAVRAEAIPASRPTYVDSDATDTWARTLEQIPTTAGRLFYVSCLKQDGADRYCHQGLARIYSNEQADRVLRASHQSVFAEWLNFSLEQQYNDLRVHLLASQPEPGELKLLLEPQTYDRFIPPAAHEPERMLYRTDLETVLELLKREL